jgi:hypothetical protein
VAPRSIEEVLVASAQGSIQTRNIFMHISAINAYLATAGAKKARVEASIAIRTKERKYMK